MALRTSEGMPLSCGWQLIMGFPGSNFVVMIHQVTSLKAFSGLFFFLKKKNRKNPSSVVQMDFVSNVGQSNPLLPKWREGLT